jgi:single-strand DNA-binding protein
MTDLKMPEVNSVTIAGNLTKDPVFRHTNNNTPVVNFFIASNRKYRDANNQWQEDVCYVGVVAWNRLAESCMNRLKKGSAVLVDGELQSHTFKNDEGTVRSIVEIKARRIQFLNKRQVSAEGTEACPTHPHEEDVAIIEDDGFDKFLSNEDVQIVHERHAAP